VIALLHHVPDLQDFNGHIADPVSQQIIAVDHQFSCAFKITAPPDERVADQMLGGLPETRRQIARCVGIVLPDKINDLL
jgi:hypothetical protein